MELNLIRTEFSDKSTIGSLSINGVFNCFILENPTHLNPALGPEHVAIPEGCYAVTIRRNSPRFGCDVLALVDVPGRTDIEIHPGNTEEDTHGCLLPGKTKSLDFVGLSRATSAFLFDRVELALERGEGVTIDISSVLTRGTAA